MDKLKTLEVLRGMKFMQRKEEAKRRATYEHQRYQSLQSRIPDGRDIPADSSDPSHAFGSPDTNPNRHESNSVRHGSSRADERIAGLTGDAASLLHSHRASATQGPVILYDVICPTSTYIHARRRFDPCRVGPTEGDDLDTPAASSSSPLGEMCVVEQGGGATANHTTSSSAAAMNAIGTMDDACAVTRVKERLDVHMKNDSNSDNACNEGSHDEDEDADGRVSADAPDPTAVESESTAEATDGKPPRRFYVDTSIRGPKMPKRLREAVKGETRGHRRRRGALDSVH